MCFHTEEHTAFIHTPVGEVIQIIHDHFMPSSFRELNDDDAQKILAEIPEYQGIQDKIIVMVQDLIFTDGWKRYLFESYTNYPFHHREYLSKQAVFRECCYGPDPYDMNNFQDLDLNITALNADDYLIFYFNYFLKDGMTLKPIRYSDDIPFQEDISPSIRTEINAHLSKYPMIEESHDGLHVHMICLLEQSIFLVHFSITHDGQVEILDQKMIFADLPIKNFS